MHHDDSPHSTKHGPGRERLAKERVAKAIARAGLASRREAEDWIAAGRVAVNGAVIDSAALNVTARDHVAVDGVALPVRQRTRLFLYHKPRGLITTHADPQGRPTIFAHLPKDLPRLISVGRLDFNTEGLLLLTNDGALARVLELPSTGWLRRYRVRVHGAIAQEKLDALRKGVTVDGIRYGPIEAQLDRVQGSNLWLTFAIREGKNREVRNVLGELGLIVTRLIRVSFGPFQLGELAEGQIEEVRTRVLREQLGPRLVGRSGADFSTPVAPARPDEARELKDHKTKNRKTVSHSWRAPAAAATKPLRRKFHGSRRQDDERHKPPGGTVRSGTVTDRQGRRVTVERHGEPAMTADVQQRSKPGRSKQAPRHRRSSPDRARGPRPSRPRSH